MRAAGTNIIVTNSTGCLEVFSSNYPNSAWRVPWIHSLFENSAAVASGVEAALRATGRLDSIRVIGQGGDGGTADIGFGALSGMFERGHDVLFVCYDNEAYMNTGVQRSGLTPYDSSTTTSPSGRVSWGNRTSKKQLPQIAVAHGVPYVATTSVGYPFDLDKKVKKALAIRGPKYIQVLVPCPLGWRHDTSLSIQIAKLAVETGLYPLLEYEDGVLTSVRRIGKKRPVEEYLKPQGRFAHLFQKEGAEGEIAKIQALADANIERFGLMEKPAEAKKAEGALKAFTLAELAAFDGREGQPAYVAYKGKVYDVTGSSLWEEGEHQMEHRAGRDLTQQIENAPHSEDVLGSFKVVGELRA
jgi:pyruvate ferredoxin oxidoreductase beta subunit